MRKKRTFTVVFAKIYSRRREARVEITTDRIILPKKMPMEGMLKIFSMSI